MMPRSDDVSPDSDARMALWAMLILMFIFAAAWLPAWAWGNGSLYLWFAVYGVLAIVWARFRRRPPSVELIAVALGPVVLFAGAVLMSR